MSDTSLGLGRYLPEEEPDLPISGKIYPGQGIALIRYHDDHYFIQTDAYSYGEVVHRLTDDELRSVRMHNLHAEESSILTEEQIGIPPFQTLVEQLTFEHELQQCFRLIHTFLDPFGDLSIETREMAAMEIEEILNSYPNAHAPVIERLRSFIPPEEYSFEISDELLARCPVFFGMLRGVQPKWQENIAIPGIQRLTKNKIQEAHDAITELAAHNLLCRMTETVATLTSCLADIDGRNEIGMQKWREYFDMKKLADAKGHIVLFTRKDKFPRERPRFEEIGVRHPEILAQFNQAEELLIRAQALLPQVEKILGEIQPTQFAT